MAPHEGRRSKNQPGGQQLGVTPLGADNLPAPSERAKSNRLAWIFTLLVMLIISYTVMLPRYGKGWVWHITTRVSLTELPTSIKPVAPAALTSASPAPALELGSSSLSRQPAEQQDGALHGEGVAGLGQQEQGPQPQQEEAQQREAQEQQEEPPQQQPKQQQAEVEPASEPAKEEADTPEPASEESAAAKAEPESPTAPDDSQPEADKSDANKSAVDETKDTQSEVEGSATDGVKDEGEQGAATPPAEAQEKPEETKNEEEDEEAKRKAAELQAHKELYQAALAEARNTPRAPPVDISHITLDPDVEDPSGEPEPRLAIAFMGQLKNMQPEHVQCFTDQILKPLLEYFNHVDVYLHSFNAVTFNNPRNGEDHVPINVTRSLENIVAGLRAVEPAGKVKIKGISITDPQDADSTYKPLEFYLAHGDPYNNEGLSLFNYLRALYSLQAVTKLWQDKRSRATLENGTEQVEYYQAVVYARSDLFYYDRLPLIPQKWNETTKEFYFETKPDGSNEWTWDELVLNNTVYTAPFDESYGLNDRFAYGRPPVMRLYGNRGTEIEDFFERYEDQALWAEPFLNRVLIEMHGVQPGRIERFRFTRVRATGHYRGSRRRLLAKGAPFFGW